MSLKLEIEGKQKFSWNAGGCTTRTNVEIPLTLDNSLPYKYVYVSHYIGAYGDNTAIFHEAILELSKNDGTKFSIKLHKNNDFGDFDSSNESTETIINNEFKARFGFQWIKDFGYSVLNVPYFPILKGSFKDLIDPSLTGGLGCTPFLFMGDYDKAKLLYDVTPSSVTTIFTAMLGVIESTIKL